MSEAVQLALVAAIAPTMAALAALVVGIFTNLNAKATLKLAETTDHKTDIVIDKAKEIHATTNGHLSKLTETLAVAHEKIEGLEKLVQKMASEKTAADGLAAKVESGKITVPPTPQTVQDVNIVSTKDAVPVIDVTTEITKKRKPK